MLNINHITCPMKIRAINASELSFTSNVRSIGNEIWADNSEMSYKGTRLDTDETWFLFCSGPMSNSQDIEPENSRELELKHVGEDIAGKRVFLGYTNTGKSRMVGLYCSAVFTTPGEGRRLVVVEKSPRHGNKEYTIKPNTQWDTRVPTYPGVYSWGVLGFNASADEYKGKERYYGVYIEADDNGQEHTLAGAYVGGDDFRRFFTSLPKQ